MAQEGAASHRCRYVMGFASSAADIRYLLSEKVLVLQTLGKLWSATRVIWALRAQSRKKIRNFRGSQKSKMESKTGQKQPSSNYFESLSTRLDRFGPPGPRCPGTHLRISLDFA